MRGINKVILVGNLGNAPELKTLADGTPVTRIKLATTELYRNKQGENTSRTQWHTIIVWRALATLAATYLQKGSFVYIEGKINYREYTTQSGEKKYVTEIFADQLLMLDKKTKGVEKPEAGDEILPF